jgi:hypothetical protein
MKFRKKSIVIEAEQFFGQQIKGVHRRAIMGDRASDMIVETLEGTMIVNEGDWIITGIEGEIYPCKDSIFRKTYEVVEGQ